MIVYYYLFQVLRQAFKGLNRVTYTDFSEVNASGFLAFLVSSSLYFGLQPFFADGRPCGLCNKDGRGTLLYFLVVGTIIFNGVLFHRQGRFIEERFRKAGALTLFPGLMVLSAWTAFILYKIAIVGR